MPLVFAAAAVHAPGITGRSQNATEPQRAAFFPAYRRLRERLEAARLDALVMVSAEHFTNFFMDNMPAFCFGLAQGYPGPSEDEPFLKIPKTTVPGAARLARALATAVSEDVDIAHSEELVLDHGFMVPLHLLTPDMRLPIVPIVVNCLAAPRPALKRCYALGRSLRKAIDARPERIGLLACGGLSHWPAVPESGKINAEWDRAFLEDFLAHRREALTRYTEEEIERDAGPGGHEIRAWIVVSAATEGATGETLCFEPIPAYAITGAIATLAV
jgi:2,3-dihydroxyphenylpropionate 1,2-dioxygenase